MRKIFASGGLQLRRAIDAAREELGDPVETWANTLTDRDNRLSISDRIKLIFANGKLTNLSKQYPHRPEPDEDHGLGDRGVGIDGVSIFAGDIRSRLDTDDWAIILRICQLKYGALSGPSGTRLAYEHIVVDEAQDLSPLNIKVVCESARQNAPSLAMIQPNAFT